MHRKLTALAATLAILVTAQALQAQQSNATSNNPIRARNQLVQPQQQAGGNPAAQIPQANYAPQRPFPELPADHQEYLDQVLNYWQQTSAQIKRSTCEFLRFDYDPELVNYRDPQTNRLSPFAVAAGKIRFSAPDKGMYETEKIWTFEAPPENPGEEAQFKLRDEKEHRERWVCDGEAVYQYDYNTKKLYEIEIPAEMRGQGIVNSPLPFFLFGVDKERLQDRYWIRVITPQSAENQIWLEAFPKRREDAGSYKKMDIIISRNDFLPESLTIYTSNYDPVTNPVSRVLEFKKRKVNDHISNLQSFLGVFVRPHTPAGWDRVKQSVNSPEASQARPASLPSANSATRR